MSNHAHDVGLPPFFVDRIAHGLAIDGKALILLSVVGIPALQRALECIWINADEHVANGAFTGHKTEPVGDAAAEAFACLRRWPWVWPTQVQFPAR